MRKKKKRNLLIVICMLISMCACLTHEVISPAIVNAATTKKVALNKSEVMLKVNDSMTLKIKNADSKKVKKITWSSSKKSIATVSSKGVVKAKKAGVTNVTCKITYKNKKTASLKCKVQVLSVEKSTKKQSLLGNWYADCYTQNNAFVEGRQMVLYENGTGKISIVEYVDDTTIDIIVSEGNGITSSDFTWSVSGNYVYIKLGSITAKYKFSESKQTLIADGMYTFQRRMPEFPEGYKLGRSVYSMLLDESRKSEMLKNQLVGTWYFDTIKWIFNQDGTGSLEIPLYGSGNRTEVRKFTYSVSSHSKENAMLLDMNFSDKNQTSTFLVEINRNGTLTIQTGDEDIKLTRTFDITNCPWTKEIIENVSSIFNGKLVNEFLTDEIKSNWKNKY